MNYNNESHSSGIGGVSAKLQSVKVIPSLVATTKSFKFASDFDLTDFSKKADPIVRKLGVLNPKCSLFATPSPSNFFLKPTIADSNVSDNGLKKKSKIVFIATNVANSSPDTGALNVLAATTTTSLNEPPVPEAKIFPIYDISKKDQQINHRSSVESSHNKIPVKKFSFGDTSSKNMFTYNKVVANNDIVIKSPDKYLKIKVPITSQTAVDFSSNKSPAPKSFGTYAPSHSSFKFTETDTSKFDASKNTFSIVPIDSSFKFVSSNSGSFQFGSGNSSLSKSSSESSFSFTEKKEDTKDSHLPFAFYRPADLNENSSNVDVLKKSKSIIQTKNADKSFSFGIKNDAAPLVKKTQKNDAFTTSQIKNEEPKTSHANTAFLLPSIPEPEIATSSIFKKVVNPVVKLSPYKTNSIYEHPDEKIRGFGTKDGGFYPVYVESDSDEFLVDDSGLYN